MSVTLVFKNQASWYLFKKGAFDDGTRQTHKSIMVAAYEFQMDERMPGMRPMRRDGIGGTGAIRGDIFKTKVVESWHFYNSINGAVYDFISEQFQEPIVYQHIPSSREEALLDTNEEQYQHLRSAFFRNMNSISEET